MNTFEKILAQSRHDVANHESIERSKVIAWALDHPHLDIDISRAGEPDWWKQSSENYLDGAKQTIWDYPEIDRVRLTETVQSGEQSIVIKSTTGKAALRPVEVECFKEMRRQCLTETNVAVEPANEFDWVQIFREAYKEFKEDRQALPML